MDQKKLESIKQLFLTRKEILLTFPSNKSIEIDGGDDIDIVQGIVLNEMAERLSLRDQGALRKINNALQKIEDGTFGICEKCEEPIGEKRLLALPDCILCIICAEKAEKIAKQYWRL